MISPYSQNQIAYGEAPRIFEVTVREVTMKTPKHAIFVRCGKFEALIVGPLAVGLVLAVITSLVSQPALWSRFFGY